jgi:hypothetical protein
MLNFFLHWVVLRSWKLNLTLIFRCGASGKWLGLGSVINHGFCGVKYWWLYKKRKKRDQRRYTLIYPSYLLPWDTFYHQSSLTARKPSLDEVFWLLSLNYTYSLYYKVTQLRVFDYYNEKENNTGRFVTSL